MSKRLTRKEWEESTVFNTELRRFLETPTGRALMDVLSTTTPMTPRTDNPPLSSQFLLVELGRTNERLNTINLIEALASPNVAAALDGVKADYSPENNA